MLVQGPGGTRLGKKKVNPLLISRAEGVRFCLYHHYLMLNIFSPSDNQGEDVSISPPRAISWLVLKKRKLSSFLVQSLPMFDCFLSSGEPPFLPQENP